MNILAIKQVLKTLQQFKSSEIKHELGNFLLQYCGRSDTFIIINSVTQEVHEFKDQESCISFIAEQIHESYDVVK